ASSYVSLHDALPIFERVAGATYRRTIVAGGETGTIEIASRGADHLALRVELPRPDGLIRIVERARRTLKLDLDPAAETRGHAPRSEEHTSELQSRER